MVLEEQACELFRKHVGSALAGAIRSVGTDAIFNRTQVRMLVAEFVRLSEEAESPETYANLVEVAAFIERQIPPTGSLQDIYVLFLSD